MEEIIERIERDFHEAREDDEHIHLVGPRLVTDPTKVLTELLDLSEMDREMGIRGVRAQTPAKAVASAVKSILGKEKDLPGLFKVEADPSLPFVHFRGKLGGLPFAGATYNAEGKASTTRSVILKLPDGYRLKAIRSEQSKERFPPSTFQSLKFLNGEIYIGEKALEGRAAEHLKTTLRKLGVESLVAYFVAYTKFGDRSTQKKHHVSMKLRIGAKPSEEHAALSTAITELLEGLARGERIEKLIEELATPPKGLKPLVSYYRRPTRPKSG